MKGLYTRMYVVVCFEKGIAIRVNIYSIYPITIQL